MQLRQSWTTVISFLVLAGAILAPPAATAFAADLPLGFLVTEADVERMGPETQAAWRLAARLGPAELILPVAGGKFHDQNGREVSLDRFGMLWYHQGDRSQQAGPVYDPATVAALRKYVAGGRGLYLSGAALAMVHTLRIETVRPRIGDGGKDQYQVKLVPVVAKHPVFRGLTLSGNQVQLTDGGYPAYADFLGTGGPVRGMLLARAANAAENPMAEYGHGKGRVIVLGWRAPNYSLATNAHRTNLERLTGNILDYLADAKQWQKIVLKRHTQGPVSQPGVPQNQWISLELAVDDLTRTYGDRYPEGPEYRRRAGQLRQAHDKLLEGGQPDADALAELAEIVDRFDRLRREALLANPLLGFDRLLLIERSPRNLGLPANWQSNSSLRKTGYDNRIAVLSPVRPEGELTTLYRPEDGRFVGDVDLHFGAARMLFSMPGSHGRWQLFEIDCDGSNLRELTTIDQADVDNYDACYLPDGRIVFSSTAPMIGVPCVFGNSHVTNLYLRSADGSVRRLTVDQDHDWCPTVAHNGRVLYLRWEYTDLPHSNSRILFHMNPDGTGQMEYYGSNSFFTNSFFYARPVPGHPTKVVGIATGHHGVARMGRLLIIDPARGRHEADGVVQEIPGHGQEVEAIIRDNLADGVWPQFLHPYPLSENYYLVSARPRGNLPWGIYLVDVFDNMVLLKESPGYALLEPVPLQKRPTPPVIADRVDPKRKDAVVYMTDVYHGNGLKGIPRGAVKKLRLFTYHFSYQGMGGLLGAVGMDGPWDIKRVLGTVPVESDGSAMFRVPANTPIAVQPLDSEGKALQIMRSWFTAMPGEVLSCVGCHERQNTVTPNRHTLASRRAPSAVSPWYGPVRGFNFHREVQPVLQKYCVGCHNGKPAAQRGAAPDLRGEGRITDWNSAIAGHVSPSFGGKFSLAYAELHRFVRRPGIESDIRLLTPMDFHADTTELVQMLRKGHYNVKLDAEAWDRLVTWIDLNAPYHGTWTEIVGHSRVKGIAGRRRELSRLYAGVDVDPEAIPEPSGQPVQPIVPDPLPNSPPPAVECPGWPFDAEEAARRQGQLKEHHQAIDLGEGVQLEMVRIPAGRFVIGDAAGHPDERPPAVVNIEKAFWIGRCEVTNEQYARFDPGHDSRVESMHVYQFGIHGYPLNGPRQPVVRVSWDRARAFCRWLGTKTGKRFDLPSEAQWEYACRAGTATPTWYGDLNTDFSTLANLGDARLREFARDTYVRVRVISNPNKYDDWIPKDARFNDGGFVSAAVGSYRPNPWGLHDMHGNVWEWTRTALRPYPYREDDGRNDAAAAGRRVVRGGSWYDRPKRCRSAFRMGYRPYHRVFNVGFRVVMQ